MRPVRRSITAWTAAAALLQPIFAPAALGSGLSGVTTQPSVPTDMSRYFIDPAKDPVLPADQMAALLRKKIKYVFVIFNENHSFDNEFGTFPGANGLYSDGYLNGADQVRAGADTPGFTQTVKDGDVTYQVTPFKIGPAEGASAVDSVDHSHTGLAKKIDVNSATVVAAMDGFAQDEYDNHTKVKTPTNIATGVQYSRLVMSGIDCDTIPFMWKWASRFALFDNIFATEDTPSTPNAVAMIAGQSGETQWVKHGPDGTKYDGGIVAGGDFSGKSYPEAKTTGVPLVGDPQPFYGSQFDPTTGSFRQPSSPLDSRAGATVASNLTFASLPLTFMGNTVVASLSGNLSTGSPKTDLADIQQDIPFLAGQIYAPVNWRWYQEGYDLERTDLKGADSEGSGKGPFVGTGNPSHNGYVLHHNGAAYFGYIADTPDVASKHLRGLTDFFTDFAKKRPPQGGVFYIRGGYINQKGLKSPVGTNTGLTQSDIATVQRAKNGDDDHPAYSDRQISEAMMATVINAVAGNRELWAQSAIIITYDESDGFYDHVPPRILAYGPDSKPLARGVRVPMLVISPYARTHVVSHVEGDHNAVIETINAIFSLPALASLPDEAQALSAGNADAFNKFGPAGFQQKYLGPRDIPSAITDSLLSGFSPKRLRGEAAPLPASFAMITPAIVARLPHYGVNACKVIGIVPEDRRQNIPGAIPGPATLTAADGTVVEVKAFNPLPGTLPDRN